MRGMNVQTNWRIVGWNLLGEFFWVALVWQMKLVNQLKHCAKKPFKTTADIEPKSIYSLFFIILLVVCAFG
jgi:hypothetical protein